MDDVSHGTHVTSRLPVIQHPLFSERFGEVAGGRRVPAAQGHLGHRQLATQAKTKALAKRKVLQVSGRSSVACLRAFESKVKPALQIFNSESRCRQASGKMPRRVAAKSSEPLRAVDLNMETDEEQAEDQEEEAETDAEDDDSKASSGANPTGDGR